MRMSKTSTPCSLASSSQWLIALSLIGLMTATFIVVRRRISLPKPASLMNALASNGIGGLHRSERGSERGAPKNATPHVPHGTRAAGAYLVDGAPAPRATALCTV